MARYLYLAAALCFLAVAVVEFLSPRNLKAAILNAITAAIFLVLAALPAKRPKS